QTPDSHAPPTGSRGLCALATLVRSALDGDAVVTVVAGAVRVFVGFDATVSTAGNVAPRGWGVGTLCVPWYGSWKSAAIIVAAAAYAIRVCAGCDGQR